MNNPPQKIMSLFASLLFVSLLAGCSLVDTAVDTASSSLWPISQFKNVCNQEAVEQASAYDAAAGKIHRIVILERASAEGDYTLVTTPELSADWVVASEQGDPAEVELVLCITRTSEEFVDTCEYEDTEDPNKTYTLNLYNANYDVKLFAATSGKELASTPVEATTDSDLCPDDYTFYEGYETVDYYATAQGPELEEFLKPYIEP